MKNPSKWIWAVLIVVILVVLFIFSQVSKTKEPEYSFEAVVLEVGETSVLVEVTEGDMMPGEAEVIMEGLKEEDIPALEAGVRIKVEFDGISTRSLPPQVPGVKSIKIMK